MNVILTAGLGLKPQHYDAARACPAGGLWFEVHPENYLVAGGPRLGWLQAIRAERPLSLHSVSASLGADTPPDRGYLRRLRTLCDRIEPVLVSEHLAWSTWRGIHLPDLLPIPRTNEALARISANVSMMQDILQRRIALENPSHYLHIDGHDWDEIGFLTRICERSGCGLLLDVNNVHVSAHNLGRSAADDLDAFPADAVMEIHLAGHSEDPMLGGSLLVDSHDAPVADAVWVLYRRLIDRIGPRPTLIERDGNLPPFEQLLAERDIADRILEAARTWGSDGPGHRPRDRVMQPA